MNVGAIANKQALTVPMGASLEAAAKQMLQGSVGAVVVTESAQGCAIVAGILTDRDLGRARLEHSRSLAALNVADVMTRASRVIDAGESRAGAIGPLQARSVRRAPVVDRDGRLLGLISTDDVLSAIATELTGLAQLVAQQGRRRDG